MPPRSPRTPSRQSPQRQRVVSFPFTTPSSPGKRPYEPLVEEEDHSSPPPSAQHPANQLHLLRHIRLQKLLLEIPPETFHRHFRLVIMALVFLPLALALLGASSASSPGASCRRTITLQVHLAGFPENVRGSHVVQMVSLNTNGLVHPSTCLHERPERRPGTGDLGKRQVHSAHAFQATLRA